MHKIINGYRLIISGIVSMLAVVPALFIIATIATVVVKALYHYVLWLW